MFGSNHGPWGQPSSCRICPAGVPHCVSSVGLDLNEFYGISAQIVAQFCPVANAGQRWVVPGRWFMGEGFEAFPKD